MSSWFETRHRSLHLCSKAKMHQIRFPLGLRPRPRWGSLQRTPRPRSYNSKILYEKFHWICLRGDTKFRAGGRTPRTPRQGGSRMLRGLMLRIKNFSSFFLMFSKYLWRYLCIMKSTRQLEPPGRPVAGVGVRWVRKHPPPHQNGPPLRLVEYRYLIISTRAGWHMIKFKIHALD